MIEILIDARAFGAKGAGFAVCLKRNEHKWTRSISCGKITSNQSELKAVEYALKSIREQFENEKVVIKSTGKYVKLMLEKDENGIYKRTSRTNQVLIDEVRRQMGRFKGPQVLFDAGMDWLREINVKMMRGEDIFIKEEE